jgi:hypothetical protein
MLLAALLLVLNDHVLKGAHLLPGAITGKLSDVCGVFLLPLVIARLARLESRRAHALVCASVAVAFAVVKTTVWGNALYGAILGRTLIDPTDLVALPAALAAWVVLGMPRAPQTWRDRAALVFAALGCMATSAPHPPMDPHQMQQQPPTAVAQGEPCASIVTTGIEPHGDEANVHFTVKSMNASDCAIDLTVDVRAKTQVASSEVDVRGQASLTLLANTTIDISVPVRGAYPIACSGEPSVNFNFVETSAISGGEYRSAGGGRTGCWQSTALAP